MLTYLPLGGCVHIGTISWLLRQMLELISRGITCRVRGSWRSRQLTMIDPAVMASSYLSKASLIVFQPWIWKVLHRQQIKLP